MISFEQRHLVHHYFILQLAIKSLQHDYHYIEQCKMKSVFLPSLEALLKKLHKQYFPLKYQLAKQQIELLSWQVVDTHFVDIVIATAGNDQTLHYASQALKTQVEQLIQQQLQHL